MKFTLGIALLIAAALSESQAKIGTLEAHLHQFNLKSSPEVITNLKRTFEIVTAINNDSHKTYRAAMNKFSHLSEATFRKMLGARPSTNAAPELAQTATAADISSLEPNVDLRKDGCISPVKDQHYCGSCWSFSTAQVIESYKCMKDRKTSGNRNIKPTQLSEAQILSCAPASAGDGCSGGWPLLAAKYVQDIGGLLSEVEYSYQIDYFYGLTEGTVKCKLSKSSVVVSGKSPSQFLQQNSRPSAVVQVQNITAALMTAVAKGPLAITVRARTWSPYQAGVFSCEGTDTQTDHAVVLVGYGTDASTNQDYWLIKNSWGEDWGEEGYIRLYRGNDSENAKQCGILTDNSYYVTI